ncbi:MAG: fatty acid--CoA ligase [Desulfobacterales bacterium]|nr:fatty acid--CoA ligase [Desulfobacterales bacterium]
MSVRIIERTPSAYAYPLLIKNLLQAPLTYAPEQEIVYADKARYTYREFSERVSRLANMLGELGVKPGDAVAVMDWDSHRYLECYFAIPMIGAVLHTINIRLPPEQLVYTINHAEDRVILINGDFLPMLEPVMDQLETVKTLVLLSDEETGPDSDLRFFGEYEALLSKSGSAYHFPDFDENAMATVFYTTGTTGPPKGVYFSHRQIVLHTYGFMSGLCAYDSPLSVDSGDVYMPLTPMFHVHAWGMPYLFTMMGNKQIYPGRYEPESILKLVRDEKVTFSHCVPTIIHMLFNTPLIDSLDLTGWKLIIGGSALPRALCKEAQARGVHLYAAYGMSETCPLLTIANLKPRMKQWSEEQQIEVRCRTGLPVPNVALEIIDAEGKPLPHDGKATGEIVARGPWLTQGYLKDPEKSEALWADGWLHTGDVGAIDGDGYLKISDRIKDVIKTGGEWVSSLEMEDIITRHEAVSEAAVIGAPDEKWGERPMALVVLKEEAAGRTTEDDLKAFCMQYVTRGVIPKYGVPDRVEFVESIARTSVGKIDKKELRKRVAERGARLD